MERIERSLQKIGEETDHDTRHVTSQSRDKNCAARVEEKRQIKSFGDKRAAQVQK